MRRYLAFFPLFFGGIFLGALVVVGQGSKEGAMQILTAIILLSDVLFKVRHSEHLTCSDLIEKNAQALCCAAENWLQNRGLFFIVLTGHRNSRVGRGGVRAASACATSCAGT